MNIHLFFLKMTVASLCLSPLSPLNSEIVHTKDWYQYQSNLEVHPKAQFGLLKNGLRYVILPNNEPQGRASLRLLIDAGSLMERDDQQGLSHFLEHMAFNGSENFPPGSLVEFFQRLGMGFGADTNAHTSFHETVYKLELPNTEPELFKQSLTMLRDTASRLNLAPAELDKERGIILSEKLTRDSASYRALVEGFRFGLPESLIPKRLPIGQEEVIREAPRERFLEYYHQYYRPERSTLIVVGEVKPEEIVPLIEEHFGDWAPVGEPGPEPDLGKVIVGEQAEFRLLVDRELPVAMLSLDVARPAQGKPDSLEARREALVQTLANKMVQRRFDILTRKDDSPVLGVEIDRRDFLRFVDSASLQIQMKPDKWQESLSLAEQEIRRAVQFGFTVSEFQEAVAREKNLYVQQVARASTRRNSSLADELVNHVEDQKVFTSAETDLALAQKWLEEIKIEECHEAFRDSWDKPGIKIYLATSEEVEGGEKTLANAWAQSKKEEVHPYEEGEGRTFAYDVVGEPGKIVARKEIKDLDVLQLDFENGVQINLKHTEFEDDTIQVAARFGNGRASAPKDKPGLVMLAQTLFSQGGLEAHKVDDLESLFAGKTLDVDFEVGESAFTLGGSASARDLEDQLKLICAYLQHPGYHSEAYQIYQRSLPAIYSQLDKTAEGVLQAKVISGFLTQEDPRYVFPSLEVAASRTVDEVRDWLSPALKGGPLQVTIVGDFEPAQMEEILSRTLGALPKRAEAPVLSNDSNVLGFPKAGSEGKFAYQTSIPRAFVASFWKTNDLWDIKRTRRLTVLSDILGDRLRLKLREELGDTYSPMCHHVAREAFKGYGFMMAGVMVSGDKTEGTVQVIKEVVEKMIAEGISEDELKRAISPLKTAVKEQRRTNRYWLSSVLVDSRDHPERLDWAREMEADLNAITLEEIQNLAKIYLDPQAVVNAIIQPIDSE